ncbi:MAG: cyclic nucleotide-binding domain-containing protein [Anaerolineales bacterium]|nr:cyclic nucleotide-binding domain-containing protein [Anaerolineales bacterium]
MITNLFQHEQQSETFRARELIFQEGQPGEVMYVIQAGEVELFRQGRWVETVGPGGILAELALVDPTAHCFTAQAKTDCQLVPINQTRFKVQVHHYPYFALQVMQVMAQRLRRMREIGD